MRLAYCSDRRGVAAVEFALWLGLLTVPLLNAIDLGFYAFQAIQVREAAEAAAQSAEALCSPQSQVPAATNCTGLSAELTSAAQSTSLGTHVTVSTSATNSYEGWYCSSTTGTLTKMGSTWALSTSSSPASQPTCTGTPARNAGDYITVDVTYTFTPLFGAVSAASLLNRTISQSAVMRLG